VKSDFSLLSKQLEALFNMYCANNSTWAQLPVDLMTREHATGEIAYHTIHMVVLHPVLFGFLKPILTILSDPEQRAHFLEIIEKALKGKEE